MLVAAAVLLAWHTAAAAEERYERAAAFRVLAGSDKLPGPAAPLAAPLPLPDGDTGRARASYWLELHEIQRALSNPRATTKTRLRRLRRASQALLERTANGTDRTRSQALSAAALVSVAEAALDGPKRRAKHLGRSAGLLRLAVELDPGNVVAKANLELLLQATAGKQRSKRDARGTSAKRQGTSKQATSSSGAGSGQAGLQGGY
jgi:hypothetical protein